MEGKLYQNFLVLLNSYQHCAGGLALVTNIASEITIFLPKLEI